MYDCPSRVSPTGDLARNPDMCPDWESNQSPSCLQAGTQSTEPHRPGQEAFSIVMAGVGASGLSLECRGPGCCQTPTVPRIGPWQGVHARTGSQEGYPLPNQVPGEAALSVLVPECLSFPICEMGLRQWLDNTEGSVLTTSMFLTERVGCSARACQYSAFGVHSPLSELGGYRFCN